MSTVGVDERAEIVVVGLNRRDPDYADRLIAAFGAGNVHVEPDPTDVMAVPPAPAPSPDPAGAAKREPGKLPPRR